MLWKFQVANGPEVCLSEQSDSVYGQKFAELHNLIDGQNKSLTEGVGKEYEKGLGRMGHIRCFVQTGAKLSRVRPR
jgi:hypothetical protein